MWSGLLLPRRRMPDVAPVRTGSQIVLLVLLTVCLAFAPATYASAAFTASPAYVYAQAPCTPVYAAPSASARLLSQLIGGSELTFVATSQSADGSSWDHVTFWSGVDGYVHPGDVGPHPPARSEEGECSFPGLIDTAPNPLVQSAGPWRLTTQGRTMAPAVLLSSPFGAGFPIAELPSGSSGAITEWGADSADQPWYQITVGSATGWLPASTVRLAGDPATQQVNGAPIWRSIAGKGMWFVNYFPHHSDVDAIIQAAKNAGLTHLYAEVAVSQPKSQGGDGLSPGFYGQGTLDRLIPAAHASGIKVIGTVYVALDHVATDVRLTAEVAQYRTPSGDRVDGIAADIEANFDEQAVYDYGQVLRATLGPDELLVANVLHPLSWPNYPFEAIAASWNVVSPMNYWHTNWPRHYTAADTSSFVARSLITLRAAVGPHMPIEELGQMFDASKDVNGEDGTGGTYAPTPEEITADMRTARNLGCIGITYYQWQDASQAEWQTLVDTPW